MTRFDGAFAPNANLRPRFWCTLQRLALRASASEFGLYFVPFAATGAVICLTASGPAGLAAVLSPIPQYVVCAHFHGDDDDVQSCAEHLSIGAGAALALAAVHLFAGPISATAVIATLSVAVLTGFWPRLFHRWRGALDTSFARGTRGERIPPPF